MAVFSRSWSLFSATWQVLKAEKSFVFYPILATLALSALILGGGIGFLATHPEVEQAREVAGDTGDYPPWATVLFFVLLFLYYLVVYFVINFFMTALVGAALQRLEGGDPDFAEGTRIARSRAGIILGYSAIAATLGALLSLLRGRQRQGSAGTLVAGIGGLAWSVATFLVVPVLAAKGLGPVAAIKESASLLRKTWGEQLTGSMGMGAAFGLMTFLVLGTTGALVVLAGEGGQEILMIPTLVVGITLFASLAVVNSTLMGIYRGAVYLDAEKGEVASQFDRDDHRCVRAENVGADTRSTRPTDRKPLAR